MSETILITSGKGGVGKSTICTMLGAALAGQGHSVLMIETDCGLRNLDIMNGVDDRAVYDLSDIIFERCEPEKAVLQSRLHENLFLIPASNRADDLAGGAGFGEPILRLMNNYEYVLIDCPAGFNRIFYAVMPIATRALVVVTPALISAKDGAKAGDILIEGGVANTRLIINMIPPRFVPTQSIPDLDAVIDIAGLQLIGAVPQDAKMCEALNNGLACTNCPSAAVFDNIAYRIKGQERPLALG